MVWVGRGVWSSSVVAAGLEATVAGLGVSVALLVIGLYSFVQVSNAAANVISMFGNMF